MSPSARPSYRIASPKVPLVDISDVHFSSFVPLFPSYNSFSLSIAWIAICLRFVECFGLGFAPTSIVFDISMEPEKLVRQKAVWIRLNVTRESFSGFAGPPHLNFNK